MNEKLKLITRIYFSISRYWHLKAINTMRPSDKKPVGIPFQRDPDNPCEYYEPVKRARIYSFSDCETDGHYLCKKCIHRLEEAAAPATKGERE